MRPSASMPERKIQTSHDSRYMTRSSFPLGEGAGGKCELAAFPVKQTRRCWWRRGTALGECFLVEVAEGVEAMVEAAEEAGPGAAEEAGGRGSRRGGGGGRRT